MVHWVGEVPLDHMAVLVGDFFVLCRVHRSLVLHQVVIEKFLQILL